MIARPLFAAATAALSLAALPAQAQTQSAGPAPTPTKSSKPFTLQDAIGDPSDFTLSGSIRARYESIGDEFRPGDSQNDDLLSLRTTLFAEYHPGVIRLGAEVMDSRGYLDDSKSAVSNNDVNALELIQAYIGADLGSALGNGSKTSIEIGRQTLDLGSRRLVARNNFRNATNAFDGVRAEFTAADKTDLTLFYLLPLNRLPSDKQGVLDNRVQWDRESFDYAFWGGFLSKPRVLGRDNLELYFYGLNERDAPGFPTKNRELYTPGLRFYAKPVPGKSDFDVEGAYQFGSTRTGTSATAPLKQVSAYFVHAELGHQFKAPWKPRLSVFYDLASGDHGGKDYTRFDGLFGARRPDFGPTGLYGPLGRNNISSPGIRLEATPSKRLDGFVAYRAAWLQSDTDSFANTSVKDATGRSGSFGGQQIEARVRYWLVPKLLRFETGGAVFFNGRFLKDAPNANGNGNPIYGYADITATF